MRNPAFRSSGLWRRFARWRTHTPLARSPCASSGARKRSLRNGSDASGAARVTLAICGKFRRCLGKNRFCRRRRIFRATNARLDTARYHHATLVQQWLARSECRIRLHFIPSYCPHLDPIERLWGLMHRHCTHNKCYAGFKDFTRAALTFLREKVPRNWHVYCDQVTDNLRVIDPADFGFSRELSILGCYE